ncbi:hypothetical protein VNO80_26050 [Phaseolus coccineus]|uniref:Uncharacterized protein n=1 Tax=Phaseolus coccineus TaxID=3886 RepID=A0AAN9M0G6_PHACN
MVATILTSNVSEPGLITAPDHFDCTQHNANISFLQSLADIIGHLFCLKTLDLSGTTVDNLPESIKNLSMMTLLKLDDCRKLVSLSELPPSLKILTAYNCTSLETVFCQLLVFEHMLQSCTPGLPKQYYPKQSEGGCVVFPGDHIRNDCGFHTGDSSITIPYLLLPELCGFICCVILSEGSIEGHFSCSIYQDSKQVGMDEGKLLHTSLISDHVAFLFVETCDHLSEIPFKFEFNYGQEEKFRIKECGVFPVAIGVRCSNAENGLESLVEVSNNESQLTEIGVDGSNNENGNEWEELLHVITSSPCMIRVWRLDGKPLSGNDLSIGQSSITKTRRFDAKPSSGNDSSTEQPCMVRVLRLDGKPLSGNDLSLGQSFISKIWRFDDKPSSGNDSSTEQPCMVRVLRLDGKPLSGHQSTQTFTAVVHQ